MPPASMNAGSTTARLKRGPKMTSSQCQPAGRSRIASTASRPPHAMRTSAARLIASWASRLCRSNHTTCVSSAILAPASETPCSASSSGDSTSPCRALSLMKLRLPSTADIAHENTASSGTLPATQWQTSPFGTVRRLLRALIRTNPDNESTSFSSRAICPSRKSLSRNEARKASPSRGSLSRSPDPGARIILDSSPSALNRPRKSTGPAPPCAESFASESSMLRAADGAGYANSTADDIAATPELRFRRAALKDERRPSAAAWAAVHPLDPADVLRQHAVIRARERQCADQLDQARLPGLGRIERVGAPDQHFRP